MRITLLKSKIHRATVTHSRLDYTGSITIDENLMDATGIVPYEKVLVANLTSGTRHETYAVKGERGSGVIMAMGAAAHLVNVGDQVIIMAFGEFDPAEATGHKPKIVLVDEHNRPKR
jgi:aspartate 1-decarboxylase